MWWRRMRRKRDMAFLVILMAMSFFTLLTILRTTHYGGFTKSSIIESGDARRHSFGIMQGRLPLQPLASSAPTPAAWSTTAHMLNPEHDSKRVDYSRNDAAGNLQSLARQRSELSTEWCQDFSSVADDPSPSQGDWGGDGQPESDRFCIVRPKWEGAPGTMEVRAEGGKSTSRRLFGSWWAASPCEGVFMDVRFTDGSLSVGHNLTERMWFRVEHRPIALVLFRMAGRDCPLNFSITAHHNALEPPETSRQPSARNRTEVTDEVVAMANLTKFCRIGVDLGGCEECESAGECDFLSPPSAIGGLQWSISSYIYWFSSRRVNYEEATQYAEFAKSRYYQHKHSLEWNHWLLRHPYPATPPLAQTDYANPLPESKPGYVGAMHRIQSRGSVLMQEDRFRHSTVSVYTQLDVKRLHRLEKMASSAQLPIHAAVYYDGSAEMAAIVKQYHARSKALRGSVTLHLVAPRRLRPHTDGSWIGRAYPIQELRNLALLATTTAWVLYAEADMHFGPDAAEALEREAKRLARRAAGGGGHRVASVVPLYEIDPDLPAPVELPRKGGLRGARIKPYHAESHDLLDYARWEAREEGDEVDLISYDNGICCGLRQGQSTCEPVKALTEWCVEPYFLANRTELPLFDPVLEFQTWDKMDQLRLMAATGWHFAVNGGGAYMVNDNHEDEPEQPLNALPNASTATHIMK